MSTPLLALFAAVRGVIFVALLLLVGTQVAAALVQRQLQSEADLTAWMRARFDHLRLPLLAVLVAGVLAKGALQVLSFHDPGDAFDGTMVRAVLTSGTWGRSWTTQLIVTAVFIAWTMCRRDGGRSPRSVAEFLTLVLIWAQSGMGHAAAGMWPYPLGRVLDATHVIGLGIWLGTLGALAIVALPALRGEERLPALARVLRAFSLNARIGVTLVVVSGVIVALRYAGPLAGIAKSDWGRLLLVKLVLMGGVLVLGWYNWRTVTPALGGGNPEARRRLRFAVRAELALGIAMLIVTAFLVATALPGEG
jgi:putative copper export protein